MIKILFFAGIAEKVGNQEVEIDLSSQEELNISETGYTVSRLRQLLIATYPTIEHELEKTMVAVNEEFADDHTRIVTNDTVAFIPPVSGG